MNNEQLPPDKPEEDYEIDTLTNERLIKDHEYDGIKELDNSPPSWFNLLFIGTIVFAFFYMYILFMFEPTGLVQYKEYAREMEKVKKETPAQAQRRAAFQIALLEDEEALNNGRQIFNNVCTVCHMADGGGLVGPNLTDDYWVHGNSIQDIYKVVTEGIIEKGMVPYRDQLSARQRLEVSSFILQRLVGTTPANPKQPEGELIPM
jgi:cytochrome c oxidase cbb3-type subunit III